jgi:hypothetical protein
VRAPKSPPPPITEQPPDHRPDPRSQWLAGYWTWDPARVDFAWVRGTWRIPPAGASWVAGRWLRDDAGWYRVPGSWSYRVDAAVTAATASRPAWRSCGPPIDHPTDTPGPAPSPDFFFVPGHYSPTGDQTTWVPGFWARELPGWDWVPARWVRRPDGWDFHPGYWTRDPVPAGSSRYTVARPAADTTDLPPALVESETARPGADTDHLPSSRPEVRRDPIAEAEAATRAQSPAITAPGAYPPVVIVPGGALYWTPYALGGPPVVIRPPGSYPYGPAGVVVPSVVPPFVQRLLDRVLP